MANVSTHSLLLSTGIVVCIAFCSKRQTAHQQHTTGVFHCFNLPDIINFCIHSIRFAFVWLHRSTQADIKPKKGRATGNPFICFDDFCSDFLIRAALRADAASPPLYVTTGLLCVNSLRCAGCGTQSGQ